ncbi:MAG: cytochrome c3 family protein [Desulfobacteria bacterium]
MRIPLPYKLLVAVIALAVSAASAVAVPGHLEGDRHVATVECTACHIRTPVEGDTLETVPLVKPVNELCLDCHPGGPGRRVR